MLRHKAGLLTGVSVLALAVSNPGESLAADIPRPVMVAKAPVVRDVWTWWAEGGAAFFGGDPGVYGLTGFDVDPKRLGWEGAIGIDYRTVTGFIWSAQFRYGRNPSNSAGSSPVGAFVGNTPVSVVGTNQASRSETHWAADFMVGRDLGIGQGQQVAKFGVRIAEIRGKTSGSARWDNVPVSAVSCATAPSYCGSELREYTQKNTFLGVGPRLQLDGSIPLGAGLALEYMGGVAGLYGRRKVDQSVTISHPSVPTFTSPATLVSGGPLPYNSSSNSFVFNTDALLGLSFATSTNSKIIINYRFDGYWNVLKGFDANGNPTNLDRYYHGPMLRFVVWN